MKIENLMKILGVFALCVTVVGCSCAKKEDLDALRADTKRDVLNASDISSKALKEAEEANSRSQRTEESVNRCFNKCMRK